MAFLYPLCSSSKGNSCYIGDEQSGILIDAGIGIRNFQKQLESVGVPEQAIQAILITHEHSDHVKGLARIVKQLQVPVYTASATAEALVRKRILTEEQVDATRDSMLIGDYLVHPFATSHDAVQSQGYCVTLPGGQRVAVCTDLGIASDTVMQALQGCHTVLLESNYEPDLLSFGSYPYFLKQRISGKQGHLSNQDAGVCMQQLLQTGTKQFVLGHLSQENNRPDIAKDRALTALSEIGAKHDRDYRLCVAPCSGNAKVVQV